MQGETLENLIKKISEKAKPVYCSSVYYPDTIWNHVLSVAELSKYFASRIFANQFIAEAAGLLHDIGAAKFGKQDHHITGANEAMLILFSCDCPLAFAGPILDAVYSHRGSQGLPLKTLESECVAAADAMEHFYYPGEVWLALKKYSGISDNEELNRVISEKLDNDWRKISRRIKPFIDGAYDKAKQQLADFVSGEKIPEMRAAFALH